ncbi:MAG: S41 family peptidase [Acidobacteriota bacterium]|jgi:carboxyl-terminal processing protease|nr:S41 family peptidase [Acidobacteriota bacterium]
MSFRSKIIIVSVSVLLSLYAVVGTLMGSWGIGFSTQAQQPINDPGAQIRIFESVLQHIQNDYVDEPNLEKVRFGALKGLAEGLDPYTAYLTAAQVKDYQSNKGAGNKVGIGAEFSQISSYLYIISVIKDSPADKAGLAAGDVIEYIGDKATRDISLYDAEQLVLGNAGTDVKFRVLRAGEKPQTLIVKRGAYQIPKVEAKMDGTDVGVIKIYSLENGEAADIREQVKKFADKGIKKIVLDLRGVATGNLNEAVEVANLFVKNGTIAKVLGRENKVIKTFEADASKAVFDGNVAAMIDLGTSGAGEVVASAILERKRGEVVGERSFGAGTEQQLFILRSGDGFLLTTAKWASPEGNPFLANERAKAGVKPSVEVKRPETPEPIEVENLVEQKEAEDEENPQEQPEKTVVKKEIKKPTQNTEDIQLKKAVEVLRNK